MASGPNLRPTRCVVDHEAITANLTTLQSHAGASPLCAVVKADAYGHGAIDVARTAAAHPGVEWLAVALVEEGIELREAGLDEIDVLVLSEPPPTAMAAMVEWGLTPSLYTEAGIAAFGAAGAAVGVKAIGHLVVDTGMRRVGAEPEHVARLLSHADDNGVTISAAWTHAPVGDEPANPFTEMQLERFGAIEALADLPVHVANSAVTIRRLANDVMFCRVGIAMYGIDPDPAMAGAAELRPALTLESAVSFAKPIGAGEAVGYGHRWRAEKPTTIATVPIGYADGVRRDLGLRGGGVLINGKRHPIVGVVTMDQLMVDIGEDDVAVGDTVTLIGSNGGRTITANDVAATLGTIGYEVTCAISKRVPRINRPSS